MSPAPPRFSFSRSGLKRIVRYLIVGGFNTLFGYGTYCLFIYLGLPFPVAGLLSLALGVLISFRTNSKLVFDHSGKGRFIRYCLMWFGVYLTNLVSIGTLMATGLNAYFAGVVASLPTFAIAFLLQRYFVFAR